MDAYVTGLLCFLFQASGKEMFSVYLSEMISCYSLHFGHSLEEDGGIFLTIDTFWDWPVVFAVVAFCRHTWYFGQ